MLQGYWWSHPDLYGTVTGRDDAAILEHTLDLFLSGIVAASPRELP